MTYPIHVLCSSGTVKFLFRRLIGIFWASYYTKLWLLLVFYGAVLMQPSSGVQELFKIGFACNVSKTTSSNLCSSELNKIFKVRTNLTKIQTIETNLGSKKQGQTLKQSS